MTETTTKTKTGTASFAKGENGYVSVTLEKADSLSLQERLTSWGIDDLIPVEKLHCTLFYAREGMDVASVTPPSDELYTAFVMGKPRIIGEAPWRAVVLELDSPALVARHEEIKRSSGAAHSYPDYLPHLSITYNPKDEDIFTIGNAFDGMVLRFTNETHEDITENP